MVEQLIRNQQVGGSIPLAGSNQSRPSQIVQKLWNYCNVLRDEGMSYGDYVEQLTYLLFLKMVDERTRLLFTVRCL